MLFRSLMVTGSAERSPATVVSYFAATRRRELVDQPRLAAFGFAMDNMKPLRWCRAETPLITVAPGLAGSFSADVKALVDASEEVRLTFSGKVKSAWSDRPKDLDVFSIVNPAFWSRTEPAFFTAVQAIKKGLEADEAKARDVAREAWLAALHSSALALFDTFVETSAEMAAPDLRRAVLARRDLFRFTHPSSTKLRKLLGLPVEESAKPRKAAKRVQAKKENKQ